MEVYTWTVQTPRPFLSQCGSQDTGSWAFASRQEVGRLFLGNLMSPEKSPSQLTPSGSLVCVHGAVSQPLRFPL